MTGVHRDCSIDVQVLEVWRCFSHRKTTSRIACRKYILALDVPVDLQRRLAMLPAVFIGLTMGLCAFFVDVSLETLNNWKFGAVNSVIRHQGGFWRPYLAFTGFCLLYSGECCLPSYTGPSWPSGVRDPHSRAFRHTHSGIPFFCGTKVQDEVPSRNIWDRTCRGHPQRGGLLQSLPQLKQLVHQHH